MHPANVQCLTALGIDVCVLANNHVLDWGARRSCRDPGVPGRGPLEVRAIVERVAWARQPGDIVVVSIHWGTTWGHEIPDEQVRFAHALIDGGVDIVHGHSSQHPRAIEIYRGRPILYGCGDFVTDYEGIHGDDDYRDDVSPMYLVSFERTERGPAVTALRIVPFRLRKMRLERATPARMAPLVHACRRFGTEIACLDDGSLVVPLGSAGARAALETPVHR